MIPFSIRKRKISLCSFKEDFAYAKSIFIEVRALKAAPDTAGRRIGCQGDSSSTPDNPQRHPLAISKINTNLPQHTKPTAPFETVGCFLVNHLLINLILGYTTILSHRLDGRHALHARGQIVSQMLLHRHVIPKNLPSRGR